MPNFILRGTVFHLFFFFLIYFIDFVQRGRERERELETSMRESHRSAASCTPPTGDVPSTKVHALDRNRTRDPSVPKPTLYPLSQTSLSQCFIFVQSGRGARNSRWWPQVAESNRPARNQSPQQIVEDLVDNEDKEF
uniref:Uncharacterized protein n=1 Tax=Pipistrellus kuhlii TaxID=59472 RepID=A0A7J7ZJA0_PIPKU|nr:hypothetical protein mPipKuh1_009397 [Pipistrellus kuhlii]